MVLQASNTFSPLLDGHDNGYLEKHMGPLNLAGAYGMPLPFILYAVEGGSGWYWFCLVKYLFKREYLHYDTETDAWQALGNLPAFSTFIP